MCCECSLCFPRRHFFNFSKVRCFKGRDTSVLPSIRAIVNPCISDFFHWCPIRRPISKLGCRDIFVSVSSMSGAFSSCRWTTRNPQETTNSKVLGFTTIACDGRWQNFAGYRFTYIYIQYIYIHIPFGFGWTNLLKKKTQINGYLFLC